MDICYICGNEVRVTLSVDAAPFWQTAQMGVLDECAFDIVTQATKEAYQDLFKDLQGINAVTYVGVLNEPDSLPEDNYAQQSVTVLCEWDNTNDTARFLLSDMLDDVNGQLKPLFDIETQMNLVAKSEIVVDDDVAVYPYFYNSVECGKNIVIALQTSPSSDISSEVEAIKNYVQAITVRMQKVLGVDNLKGYATALSDSCIYLDKYMQNVELIGTQN